MRKPSDGPWTLPKQFGNYELVARLGGGTLGELFRATRNDDGLVCEVRCFPQSFGKRMLGVLEEAKAVAKLRHPNIREVYEVGREKGVFFAALELIETRTMEDALTDPDDPLDLGRGVEALAVVAHALNAAHEAGVVHGHLRPEHVLISLDEDADENYVKIENFGFEKLRTASMLVASGSVDRARFLAPEQAEEQSQFDARTDVYAVGAMLYRLVTGRFHVDGETIHQILRNIAEGNITPPGDVTTNLDGDVEAVILRALAVNPGDRYSTAAALGKDLERLAHGEKPRARDMAKPTMRKAGTKRSRVPLLLLLLLLVLAGGGAAVWTVPALRARFVEPYLTAERSPSSAPGTGAAAAQRTNDGTGGGAGVEHPASGTDPGPAPDLGRRVRDTAAQHLAADDATAAIALLTPHLADHPGDAEALALRGLANALRGELDRAERDLDTAKGLTDGADGVTAGGARALLCWKLARATFESAVRGQAEVTATTWEQIDCALQRADMLPGPVDLMAYVEPWVRGGRGLVAGWEGLIDEKQVPDGPLRRFIVVAERLSEDPVPDNESAALAAALARYPGWADPMAHEAMRLRRAGAIADGRAMLHRAAEADPTHPNVALVQAVYDTLDRKEGAIARGIAQWEKSRGKNPHSQRMFYFCLRDRLRESGAPLDSAHCILTYLKEADQGAMQFVLRMFWSNIWQTLQTDLNRFGGEPGPEPGADQVAYVIRNLATAKEDVLLEHARAALAEDRNDRYAAVLGMYLTRDKRGVLSGLNDRLQEWRTPLERVADQLLDSMAQEAGRGNFDGAIRLIQQAFQLIESDTHVRRAMRSFGMACINSGQDKFLSYFENVLNGWANGPAHPVKVDALRWRARVQERRKQLPKAWADLDAALVVAGTREREARFWRAFLAMRTADYTRAMEECTEVIRMHPDDARGYLWRGMAELLADMPDAAAADLQAAIGKGEKDPLCRILAALAAIAAGDHAAALVHCEEAMGSDAAAASEAWWLHGRLRMEAGRENEAITDWADAITTNGSHWGQDVPIGPLMQPTMRLVGRHARILAERVMDEAGRALSAGDSRTAANFINSLRLLGTSVNSGRRAYVLARYRALSGGDPMSVFQLLEQALQAGWKHPAEWGAEKEFAPLRQSARFKELQVRAGVTPDDDEEKK